VARKTSSQPVNLPAPIGGLNTRDAFGQIPKEDALMLDNWFPAFGRIEVRNGSVTWATGLDNTVKSLLVYNSTDVGKQLFAVTNSGSIYDVTGKGTVGAAVSSGISEPIIRYVNFGSAANHYLVCVNGVDPMFLYNGSTWAQTGTDWAPTVTGTTTDTFTNVTAWRNRLWFTERNSARVWYGGLLAIGGAVTSFDLSGYLKRGGYIKAIGTFAASNTGSSLDEFIGFISSEGEIVVYGGSDPTVTGEFYLVGLFRCGKPIGWNCLTNALNEAVLITDSGLVTLSALLGADVESAWGTVADKVRPALAADALLYKRLEGWQCEYAPRSNKLIVNVPTRTGIKAKQYVMNTVTKAWCSFSGWNLTCLAYFDSELYGGIGDKVYKLDQPGGDFQTQASPGGTAKTAKALCAYTQTPHGLVTKQFHLARILMNTDGGVSTIKLGVNVDFQENALLGELDVGVSAGGIWDVALWDNDVFGYNDSVNNQWVTVQGVGMAAALKTEVTVSSQFVAWQSWELVYTPGGIL